MKLKDYKYEIKGRECNTPGLELLSAILVGLFCPLLIAVIVYFADKIDAIENFYVAYGMGITALLIVIFLIAKK